MANGPVPCAAPSTSTSPAVCGSPSRTRGGASACGACGSGCSFAQLTQFLQERVRLLARVERATVQPDGAREVAAVRVEDAQHLVPAGGALQRLAVLSSRPFRLSPPAGHLV